MNSPKSAPELLDMFYLHMRSALLETAAAFDRIQAARGAEEVWEDRRMQKLRAAAELIVAEEPERARRILESLSVGEGDA
jgi:hypothetical protein